MQCLNTFHLTKLIHVRATDQRKMLNHLNQMTNVTLEVQLLPIRVHISNTPDQAVHPTG